MLLRDDLSCPLCSDALRVIAYRVKGARLECRACGLRFSVDIENYADARANHGRPSEAELADYAHEQTEDPAEYADILADIKRYISAYAEHQRAEVLEPHRAGQRATLPRPVTIKRPFRMGPATAPSKGSTTPSEGRP